jgi:hypothetical protein
MSDDPVRWVDDPDAPAALREDLSRTAALGSAGFSVAAGLARLEAAKGAATGAGKALAWWLIGGGTAVVIGVAAWGIGSRPAPAPVVTADPPPPIVSVAAAAPVLPPAVSVEVIPTATAVAALPVKPAVTAQPKTPDPDAVQAELAQLARIRELGKTDPASALSGATDGDRQFPKGLMHQEREVVAIDALSKLGRRGEARSRARSFLTTYPQSTYAEHVRGVSDGN